MKEIACKIDAIMYPLLCLVDLVCGTIPFTKRVLQPILPTIFKFLIPNASQPEQSIRFYERLTLEMSASEPLNGGQFTQSFS